MKSKFSFFSIAAIVLVAYLIFELIGGVIQPSNVDQYESLDGGIQTYTFRSSDPKIPPSVFRFEPINKNEQLKDFSQLLYHLNYKWINEHQYLLNVYDCKHFAYQLYLDALRDGFSVRFVAVRYSGHAIGHALNAFKTSDKGIVFVDFTAMKSKGDDFSSPSKGIVWAQLGRELLSIPVKSVTDDFSNTEDYFLARINLQKEYIAKAEAYSDKVKKFNKEYADFARNVKGGVVRDSEEHRHLIEISNSFESRHNDLKSEKDDLWFEEKRAEREGVIMRSNKVIESMRFLPENF